IIRDVEGAGGADRDRLGAADGAGGGSAPAVAGGGGEVGLAEHQRGGLAAGEGLVVAEDAVGGVVGDVEGALVADGDPLGAAERAGGGGGAAAASVGEVGLAEDQVCRLASGEGRLEAEDAIVGEVGDVERAAGAEGERLGSAERVGG